MTPGAFRCRTWGPEDGIPVLALHGFPQTSAAWDRVAPLLGNAGYRVVAFDQRGYRPETRPADDSGYRLDHLLRDVLDVAAGLGVDSFHVLGHDWGGWLAWHLAATAPQHVLSVAALCTPHPAALADAAADDPEQAAALGYLARLSLPGAADALLADNAAVLRGVLADTPDPAVHLAVMTDPGTLDAALGWYRAGVWRDTDVPAVTVPALYLWPDQERVFLRSAAERVAGHCGAGYRFATIAGAGHWVAETHPDQVASSVLDLWSSACPTIR